MSDDLDPDTLHIFVEEANELLEVLEEALLRLESSPDDSSVVEELFRAFHTIKGSAGLFGLDPIVEFTHVVESVLDRIRTGELSLDEDISQLFLLSRDQLADQVAALSAGTLDASPQLDQRSVELSGQLNFYLGESPQTSNPTQSDEAVSTSQVEEGECVANARWHISLRFGINALRNGMDPGSFLNYLASLGDVQSVSVIEETLPDWADLDPEDCFLGFEIALMAQTSKEDIEAVFEFVQDDCQIFILPPHTHIQQYVQLIEELDEAPMQIGEMLVATGALTRTELDQILSKQWQLVDQLTGSSDSAPRLGEVAVEQQAVPQPVVDAAVKKQQSNTAASQQTIRVNAAKLEQLINLVGELVIGGANADLKARQLGDLELVEAMENMSRLVEDIRDTTLGLRMVQIGDTFNRFRRVIREVSKELNKDIELRISGAETELDKTVIEKIGDPLMHLVRNAVDHGIESAEVRSASGKPAVGTVTLDAFHDSGSIVIQISDDGGGLDAEKLRIKAVEKGLISDEQTLSDAEIYRLIFAPGFSTASAVTNLSGRGVGMDVVKRNIDALRGQVDVASGLGKGTTFTIRLPLTLAIIDGFQVKVGSAHYIIPLDMVETCIELDQTESGADPESNYVNFHGAILPFVRLRELFDADEGQPKRENIVVVAYGGERVGIVVDELQGEHQTVIKPLGRIFKHLSGISGSTILGNGEVALIIDVPGLVRQVTSGTGQPLQADETRVVKTIDTG